jgi:hypothetical protein
MECTKPNGFAISDPLEDSLLNELFKIAQIFNPNSPIRSVLEHGGGNVNDTYMVESETQRFVLQRINTHVFKKPENILDNMVAIDKHVADKQDILISLGKRRWEMPTVLRAQGGLPYHWDSKGNFWRAISFIGGSTAHQKVQSAKHAWESGFALGFFQLLISDMNIADLHDTLPGFHVTPGYLAKYQNSLAKPVRPDLTPEVRYCKKVIEDRSEFASILEDAVARGELHHRPIHGDPKAANIMIDNSTGEGIALIDLDTAKPGLIHYDIGDCIRSCCNPLGEETQDFNAIKFDIKLAREILRGYLSVARDFLTKADYAHLYNAIRLIPLELGIRFFTDHLDGDVYFKVKYPSHNLNRAIIQFKLLESIEAQETAIRTIIEEAAQ